MEYKISVILPIHNVAAYIGEALDSILEQTIGHKNLQVIMVDDGSTDESPKIMQTYEEEFENFKAIYLHKKSGAAGKPRNEGLKVATADYIMFLDPDDIYDKNACKSMYDKITSEKVDIVTANYNYMDEDGKIWDKPVFDRKRFESFRFGRRSFSESFFIWNSSVCNKIFSRKLIEKNKIKFLEGVPGEDAYFTYATLLKTDHVYYLSDTIYYYRRRTNTGTLSVSWNRSIEYFQKMNYSYKQIYELFLNAKKLDLYRYFYAKTLTSIFYKLVDTNLMNDEEKATILKEMTWFYNDRETLKMNPCQKSLNIVFDKVKEGKYEEAVQICHIIAEMREYVPKEIRENMSKPENIQYKEIEMEDHE
jgi:glycosyltransferase involved in cell wall biosynthesis